MDTFSCNRCQIVKSIQDNFYKTTSTRGHSTLCKVCMNADSRAWKKSHKAAVRKHDEGYRERHKDALIISNRIASKTYRERHPEKRRESQQAYHERNLETIRIKNRTHSRNYRATHLEQCIENARDWRKDHPEERRQSFKEYRLTHLENFQAYAEKRRAREAGVTVNDLTPAQWREIQEHYDYRCVYCGRKMKRLTQDHISPVGPEGPHTLHNIVPACRSCNSKKQRNAPPKPVQPMLLTIAPSKKERAS